LTFVFITGLVTATNGIAMAEGATKAIFPQPFYEILISLGIGFIPLADVIWQHTQDKETDSDKEETKTLFSNLIDVLKALKEDKKAVGRLPGGRYDPDPRRRNSRHGHRKGIEPAGLKRWRLAHKRTHDPGSVRSYHTGRRGGHYFQGPRKRRYDPQRFARARGYARRAGSKLESSIRRFGTPIGALLGALAGIWTGIDEYKVYGPNQYQNYWNTIVGGEVKNADGTVIGTRHAEITHLWETTGAWNPLSYVKYKFLGTDPTTGAYTGSAWVIPFWLSLIGTLAGPIAKIFTNKGQRFLRPIQKIATGSLIVSTIGALALPGSPNGDSAPQNQFSPPNQGGTPMRPLNYTYGQK
jgi:hypothetical protein